MSRPIPIPKLRPQNLYFSQIFCQNPIKLKLNSNSVRVTEYDTLPKNMQCILKL